MKTIYGVKHRIYDDMTGEIFRLVEEAEKCPDKTFMSSHENYDEYVDWFDSKEAADYFAFSLYW